MELGRSGQGVEPTDGFEDRPARHGRRRAACPPTARPSSRRPASRTSTRWPGRGVCGVSDPVLMGITPGQRPGAPGPLRLRPAPNTSSAAGILEALGSGVEVGRNDLVARGNFATVRGGLVADRRAGRIPTEENVRICGLSQRRICPKREGVEVRVFPGKEHRFVARFTAEGLADALTDADPQKEGKPPVPTAPLEPEAGQGLGRRQPLPRRRRRASSRASPRPTRPCSAASPSSPPSRPCRSSSSSGRRPSPTTPCTRAWPSSWAWRSSTSAAETADLFDALEKNWARPRFLLRPLQKDGLGRRGRQFRRPRSPRSRPSTRSSPASRPSSPTSSSSPPTIRRRPCLKGHSWHPEPVPPRLADGRRRRRRRRSPSGPAPKGMLGRFRSISAMPLMLAHALKLKKYGA